MNRKLLNGFLVLAVAAGGVGTFTSCKDEDFTNNDVLLEQELLQQQLEGLRNVTDAAFKQHLEEWLNNWTDQLSGPTGFSSYAELVNAANTMYDFYKKITTMGPDDELPAELEGFAGALYNWMFKNYIEQSEWYKEIGRLRTELDELKEIVARLKFDNLSMRASSVEVNNVFNPVFGTINLPVGITSTVLATYKYESKNEGYAFPAGIANNIGLLAGDSPSHDLDVLKVVSTLAAGQVSYDLPDGIDFTTPEDFGNMGGAVVSINPIGNNYADAEKYTVELVKSNGDVAMSTADKSIELEPFNDVIYFGGTTRADEANETGLFRLNANATLNNYSDLTFDLDKSELKDAVEQAVHEKNISSMAHLGEMVLKSINETIPAYAVRVSWEEENADSTILNNSVYSKFDLAAIVLHPLSHNTQLSAVLPSDKQLPYFSPLVEYLDEIQNKLNIKIELEDPTIDPVDFEIKLMVSMEETKNGKTGYVIAYDKDGNELAKIPYDASGLSDSAEDLESLVNAILEAAGIEINQGLNTTVNDQVLAQLRNAFSDINSSIQEQLEAQTGSFNDFFESIKESNKLNYAQKLVDVYNKLAVRANWWIKHPDRFMQVMMGYSAGDGPHHLSNDPHYPVRVNSANGDGIELITTSYNGDIVTPSFKKYVAITGVVEPNGTISTNGLQALNTAAELNKVFPGSHQRVAMKISGLKGKMLRLTYISVDYRGMCSMNNYYIHVY